MLTYTAADSRGHIIGGGISPGIQSRFKVMSQDASELPEISIDELKKRIEKAIFSNLPIPLFARDTKDAMIVNILSEIWHGLDRMIHMWLERTNNSPTSITSRTVFITGGTGYILRELLGTNREKIIDVLKNEAGIRAPFTLDIQPCLIHKGIAAVILKGSESSQCTKMSALLPLAARPNEPSVTALSFLNTKVAKKIQGIDLKGIVTDVTQENLHDFYHIRYESGYTDIVELPTLKALIANFHRLEVLESSQLTPSKRTRNGAISKEDSEVTTKTRRTPEKEHTRMPPMTIRDRHDADSSTTQSDHKSTRRKVRKTPEKESTINPPTIRETADQAYSATDASIENADVKASKAKKLLIRPRDYINLRVMKYFVDENSNNYLPFYGTVDDYEYVEQTKERLWHITYDDGDGEHCNHEELFELFRQYKKNRANDPHLN